MRSNRSRMFNSLASPTKEGCTDLPVTYAWTTVIRLVVNVPVLSEQIVDALPIVSQASKCRTRLLSVIIFYSNEIMQIISPDHYSIRSTYPHSVGEGKCDSQRKTWRVPMSLTFVGEELILPSGTETTTTVIA